MEEFAMAMGVFFTIWLVIMLVAPAISITMYVFASLGTYRIAKRRGIHNPWLAWLPVGQAWILGSISDHYQKIARGKERNFRTVMLWLQVGMYAFSILMSVISVVMSFSTAMAGVGGSEEAAMMSIMGSVGILLIVELVFFAVCITHSVFAYICYYDLFRSCKPDNAVLFLILGIFISVTLPFFVFACSKYDEGMPPKIRSTVNG